VQELFVTRRNERSTPPNVTATDKDLAELDKALARNSKIPV
jgi:hypothetical protein